MRKTLLLVLPLLLLSASLFANDQTRREKREMMRAERLAAKAIAPAKVQGTDAGWVTIDLENADHNYRAVHVKPGGVIWLDGYRISNDDDVVWLSVNNGATWSKKIVPSGPNGMVFDAKDANVAVAADFAGNIHYTTDGGNTWTTVFSYGSGVGFFDHVEYVDSMNVLAVGDADGSGLCVAKSTDGGATWTRLNNLPAEEANPDKWFSFATNGSAGDVYNGTLWVSLYTGSGTLPRILKTTDLGATWTSWEVALTGGATQAYYMRSLQFADANVGYTVSRQAAAGSANWMHKTTDGGVTWSDTLSFEAGVPHIDQRANTVVPLQGTNTLLAVGLSTTGAKSWWSTDAGATWANVPTNSGGNFLNAAFADPTTVYGAGRPNFARFNAAKDARRVTFTVNTATVPDTLPVTGQTMQIRGGVNHAGGYSPITWGNDIQNEMDHVGGDYWSKSMTLQVGDTLRYKYVVTYASGTGWEQGVVPAGPVSGGDRVYIVGDTDTTLDVEFWNNGPSTNDQYWRPWTAVEDSFMNVYFRVSMIGPMGSGTFGFNPDVDQVGVRGGGPAGGDLNWAPTFYLTRETNASNGDGYTVPANTFWSGRVRIPKSGVTEGQEVQYKYLIGADWGRDELQGQPNRSFHVPAGFKDTTLQYVYFNNERSSGRVNADTMIVTFRSNLTKAISTGGFAVGDTLEVQTGWFGTGAQIGRPKVMQQVIGSIYQVTDTIVTSKGALLDYQYYVYRNGTPVRENYYNFTYEGPFISEAERRQILVPATGTSFSVTDTATSVTQDRRQPQFPNGRKLAQDVLVTWTVDVRPAIYQVMAGDTLNDIQTGFHVTPADVDSILGWGVWMNGPAVGGWSNPGGDWGLGLNSNPDKKLYDDGTNGDAVAGDSVFTRQVLASPDSVLVGSKDLVGQTFKFGIRGGDNEGGKGGFGNNHNENIVDTAPTYTLESQFGSINPAFYNAWDYDAKGPATTDVSDPNQPLTFALDQNYPNPFNPSTKIQYSIPAQAKVVLKIYNVVGQEVATLVDEVLPAGVHNARFDASSLATGVYMYRLTAGDFTSVKKMLLLK
jgi:hypothetical protein